MLCSIARRRGGFHAERVRTVRTHKGRQICSRQSDTRCRHRQTANRTSCTQQRGGSRKWRGGGGRGCRDERGGGRGEENVDDELR